MIYIGFSSYTHIQIDTPNLLSSVAWSVLKHRGRKMNWVSRKMHLYNVTMGLYMLDWWERCLFNVLMLTLLWFICYNGSRFATEFYQGGHQKYKLLVDGRFPNGGSIPS
ncbi:unnamed protein product [Musa textilis]